MWVVDLCNFIILINGRCKNIIVCQFVIKQYFFRLLSSISIWLSFGIIFFSPSLCVPVPTEKISLLFLHTIFCAALDFINVKVTIFQIWLEVIKKLDFCQERQVKLGLKRYKFSFFRWDLNSKLRKKCVI